MWVGPGAEEGESSWEKNTFGRTRGAGLSNLHTSLPERLMHPPLVIQQWAQEHYGVYPGSSSHRSTYCPQFRGSQYVKGQFRRNSDLRLTFSKFGWLSLKPYKKHINRRVCANGANNFSGEWGTRPTQVCHEPEGGEPAK